MSNPTQHSLISVAALVAILTVAFMPIAAIAAPQAADVVVRDIFQQVLAQLEAKKRDHELTPDEAKTVFAELLNPRIEYVSLARWILREHWKNANDEQRRAFLNAFQNYIINTYALALSSGDDVELEVEPEPVLRKNAAIVKAAFSVGGDDAVPLEFRLIERDEQWKLFDVSFAGVSLALTFRSDFSYVAQDGGIDAITTHLVQRAGGTH